LFFAIGSAPNFNVVAVEGKVKRKRKRRGGEEEDKTTTTTTK
jgi:hypothetical protein